MERGLFKNHRQQWTMPQLLLIFAAILTDRLIAAQRVSVEPATPTVLLEGQQYQVLCRYGEPINYCRFEIPGESSAVVASPEWPIAKPGFSYYGEGWQAGQCGMIIERVKASQHGQIKCTVTVRGQELHGFAELIVALPPQQPEIEVRQQDRDGSFSTDKPLAARCIVRDGRPAANITWFLGDSPVSQGLGQPIITEHPGDRNTTLFSTEQEISIYLTPEDNGKPLICRSVHLADNGEHRESKIILNIRYKPVPQPDFKVYGLILERTALVNVTIQASPRPQVEWFVDGVTIPQGTQNGRYAAYEPNDLGNGHYNVTLSIAGLTLEDTTKEYNLRASNGLGVQDYKVRISSSATPPAEGLGVGGIVGIVVAAAIVLLAVLLIIFARATGRWCFAGKSVKSSANETSDTESADVKTATDSKASKSKRLPTFSAIFKKNEKSKKDQKDATATAGQANEDEQRLANNGNEGESTTGGSDGNDNETKEDKQLVYAELVLKPADDDKPMPPKPSTEYAEIVYVQKQAGHEESDTKAKK